MPHDLYRRGLRHEVMIDIACMRVCTEQEGRLKCVSSLVRIHDFDVFVCDESLMMPDTIVKPKVPMY